jgi:hypothetical protein
MSKQFIFIPGMARSGTTWVANWLDQHDDVQFLDETYIIQRSFEMRTGQWTHRFITDIHVRKFLTEIYEDASDDKPIIVDKSPASFTLNQKMLVSDYIHSIFPEAKVLLMYRDGKHYVYSVMNLPWGNAPIKDVEHGVRVWNNRAKVLINRRKEFGPNVMTVRYEDLLDHPAEKSKEIADFLGLDLPAIEPWKKPVKTKNTMYVADRWKRFSSEELLTMTKMNPFLKKLGYDLVKV